MNQGNNAGKIGPLLISIDKYNEKRKYELSELRLSEVIDRKAIRELMRIQLSLNVKLSTYRSSNLILSYEF